MCSEQFGVVAANLGGGRLVVGAGMWCACEESGGGEDGWNRWVRQRKGGWNEAKKEGERGWERQGRRCWGGSEGKRRTWCLTRKKKMHGLALAMAVALGMGLAFACRRGAYKLPIPSHLGLVEAWRATDAVMQ